MRIAVVMIGVLLLCGCGTEPEDREFVTAIAISGDYELSVLTAEGEIGEETDEKNEGIVSAEGKSIREAVNGCEKMTAGELFFGHTVVCVVNTKLLENGGAVKEIAEYMAEDTRISRRVILLASDNPKRVLNGNSSGMDVADFVKAYYKTHKNEPPTELDKLCRALEEMGDIIIPVISRSSEFEIEGAVALSDGVLVKKLSDTEYKKVAWLLNDNTPKLVSVTKDGKNTDAEIRSKSVRVYPDKIEIRVKLETEYDEYEEITDRELNKLEDKIKNEATEGLEILREYGCDAVDMHHALEKKGIDLAEKTNILDDVEVNVVVKK